MLQANQTAQTQHFKMCAKLMWGCNDVIIVKLKFPAGEHVVIAVSPSTVF